MVKKAITLQQLEDSLADFARWLRDKLRDYIAEPAAEGKSGYVLTTNGAGGPKLGIYPRRGAKAGQVTEHG